MYIGIDLGGTNIAAGLVNEKGDILIKDSTPTLRSRSFQEIIRDMGVLVSNIIKSSGCPMERIMGVGIGSPGVCDNQKGTIVFANNLGWVNVPISSELKKYIDKPVYMDNDANVAGLAEYMFGAGRGYNSSITLTIGTGLGGGIVMDGKIYPGSHGVGAELGHFIFDVNGLQCTCGNKGCWEQYVSATALATMAQKAVSENDSSLMLELAGGQMERIDAKVVEEAAKKGDYVAIEVFDRFIYYLAMGIISIINTFDPEVIIIGGGVSKAGEFLLEPLKRKVEEHIFYNELGWADIRLAQLGNDAGIIGAAMLAKQ
ncbi:MAG: ROK family protein [Mahellales bacterium]|jgi:glucokinase